MRVKPSFHEGEEPSEMNTYSLIAIQTSPEMTIIRETELYSRKQSVNFQIFFP